VLFPGRKATLVFGISNDKDVAALADELAPVVGRVILTKADHPRAENLSEAEGRKIFRGIEVEKSRTVRDALDRAIHNATKDDIIVVVGSIFLAAEARKAVLGD